MRKIDKSDMLSLLLSFPLQCKAAFEIGRKAKILFARRNFSKIIFAGMGGSAIGADLVRSYLYLESKIPIYVCRDYQLPNYVDSSTLVFICSYSGNTEETLSGYKEAKKRRANLVVISSGGAAKAYARQDQVTFIEIPAGMPPRCALGYLSIIPLTILSRIGLAKDIKPAVHKMISTLEYLRKNILGPEVKGKKNIAKHIAKKIVHKFPIIYSSSIHFDVVATRFRSQLDENSKTLASSHVFPEMNHNEIVGWYNPKKLLKDFIVVIFRDPKIYPRVIKRIEITKDILKQEEVNILEIWSKGQDLLSRIFSLIYSGDFISYYLALLYGVDPTPVEKVTYLKKRLSR